MFKIFSFSDFNSRYFISVCEPSKGTWLRWPQSTIYWLATQLPSQGIGGALPRNGGGGGGGCPAKELEMTSQESYFGATVLGYKMSISITSSERLDLRVSTFTGTFAAGGG